LTETIAARPETVEGESFSRCGIVRPRDEKSCFDKLGNLDNLGGGGAG